MLKQYTEKLRLDYTYSTNGKEIYQKWRDKFASVPLEDKYGT